jgi:hypothetical protein
LVPTLAAGATDHRESRLGVFDHAGAGAGAAGRAGHIRSARARRAAARAGVDVDALYGQTVRGGGGQHTTLHHLVGAAYKLNSAVRCDPYLVSACFQTSNLMKCDILVSKFAFKWVNLCRYHLEIALAEGEVELVLHELLTVGLYKLNP